MPATLNTISAILKEVYQPRVREQLQNEITLLKRIESSSDGVTSEVGGKYVTFPVHTRRNAGIGARNEGEALPIPGQQGTAAARIGLAYLYAGIQLTGQTIALSDSNAQAFTKALDMEVNGAKDDAKKDFNRQLYGNGVGAIGTVSAVGTTSTTVTVSDATRFQIGMQVDIVTLPSTVANSNLQVTAINAPLTGTHTITVSSAVTTAIGQIITRTGNVNREILGLGAVVSNTGTIYNIDPTVEPVWKSVVDSNGGTARALSEGLMVQMADQIRLNGGSVSLIIGGLGARKAYFDLLSQQRQVVNTQDFEGGFKGLAFTTDAGEIPMVADVDAPRGSLYFLNEKDLTLYQEHDWEWDDRSGSMWTRKSDSSGTYDAWYAYLTKYANLGTDRRNTHGVIQDLQVSY
jgi:hypothetical protein